ncbi:MAG TPA: glycosyltransferase [Nocardioides sp.]|nr:glycosyltransferase [Nocardioides sp.]
MAAAPVSLFGARRRGPRVSVVVPVYNLAESLEACLDSVLAQRGIGAIEVVAVDDGSTDGSGDLLDRYAARHPEVRVVHQANGGVSRARNHALELCTGFYVTFVDPDDVVPPGGWAPLVRSLDRTGSDFAVGMMERVGVDGRRSRPPLLARNHAVARPKVSIDEAPLLIADVFPCNKLFRLDFWRGAGLGFPVDLRYEDQVFATEAFLAARRFDVLTEVVYDWHVRDDLSSATQRRARLDNLADRMTTKQMSLERVVRHGNAELTDLFYREVLPIDMWEHFRAAVAPGTDQPEDYWRLLRDGLRAIWNESTVPFEDTAVPPAQRLMGWLTAHDRRDDLARLIAEIDGPGVPVVDGIYQHPWRDASGVPEIRA